MRTIAAIAMCLGMTACVADSAQEDFQFGQSKPVGDGKADSQCGAESCDGSLCGYDCTTQGAQCTESCASADGRAGSFVAASVSGSASGSFDSRTNPYAPLLALDNVLVYGCELWDYSDQTHDGLEIQFEELIHSSFAVDPNDPTKTGRDFSLYAGNFTGPGSYRAQAQYRSTSESASFASKDGCSLDVAGDAMHGITGSFDCTLPSQAGGSVSVKGTFSCAENAMRPIFSKWAAAPQH